MPSVVVRPIREHELEGLDAWLWHWPGLHRARYGKQLEGEGIYLVAWDGEFPIGHAMLCWTNPSLPVELPACADISDLFVHTGHRHLGIASEIIYKAEELALAAAFEEIGMVVGVHNRDAWRLYHHLGYRPSHFLPFINAGKWTDTEGKEHSWLEEVRYFTKDLRRQRHAAAEQNVVDISHRTPEPSSEPDPPRTSSTIASV